MRKIQEIETKKKQKKKLNRVLKKVIKQAGLFKIFFFFWKPKLGGNKRFVEIP